MTKTTMKIGTALLGTALVAVAALGSSLAKGVFHSGRQYVQQKARAFVSPVVAFQDAVRQAESQLPQVVTDLKFAIQATDEQLKALTRMQEVRQEGLRLIDRDLETLAGSVRDSQPLELRGTRLSVEQARQEAARLMAKKKQYEQQLKDQSSLQAKVRQQKQRLEHQLLQAEIAMNEFANKARHVRSKIALNDAAERVEQIALKANGNPLAGLPSTLDELDQELDRRLQERTERTRMREDLDGPDEYIAKVREAQLLGELARLYPADPEPREE